MVLFLSKLTANYFKIIESVMTCTQGMIISWKDDTHLVFKMFHVPHSAREDIKLNKTVISKVNVSVLTKFHNSR